VSHYSIQSLPQSERPRERLMKFGPESMAASELIAIILGSGMKGRSVLVLAQELVAHFGTLARLAQATIEELRQIKGIGQAKAVQLRAIFSLSTRLASQSSQARYRVDNPIHAYHLVKDELQHEKREFFMAILLDTKGYVICHEVIAIGTLSNTLVHPREVFYPAIRHKAASLIVLHNHPSGDPTPSPEDIAVTQKLVEAGKLVGIPVNDHIIVGDQGYVSLRQKGHSFN